MDLATLIGIVSGFALLLGAILMGSPLSTFINVPGLVVVIGGTIAATLIMQKAKHVLGAFSVLKNAFFDRSQPIEEMLPTIIRLAAKARKEGLVALEGEQIDDPFMARGVRLGVDGLSPEIIDNTLRSELSALKLRHDRGQKTFRFISGTAPAMGMIGTLIGLVQMLRALDDPDAIGPGMAVALLTTLYGAILAFLVFGPIADKLEARTTSELAHKRLAIVGVDSILRGDNSMVIQSKLEAYLSPQEREKVSSSS
jgi:chemotaxis protein MotA